MTTSLGPARLSALLDILTHYDTYSEIRDFRYLGALKHYGPPFTKESNHASTSPALQALISRFILDLPGIRDVPPEFWTIQIRELIEQLEGANLSESYDKGSVGSRKTLATAISALLEYPVRGTFGGFAEVDADDDEYDLHSAESVARGFRDFVDQCVYGSVLEDLVKKASETDRLEDHTNSTKAVHEFVLVNLASFMHYTLVLSPKGQYLLKLVDNANKLIPYLAIRQTLRIGNIATMLSGMVRLILAKMSVASLTNWIGLTDTQDDGMNLLQQIISTVLGWDIKDLETRLSKIEKDKICPSKEVRKALDDYTEYSREKQEEIRQHSQTSSTSIVMTILADASKPSDMQDDTHALAAEYLACKLSIRDRNKITSAACHSHPDHLTTMVRSLFTAYEPVIRQFHDAVNLSDTVADFQAFITDMLKVAKIPDQGKDGSVVVPSVGDFVQLLRKHQYSSHKFIHQLCKNGKEVTKWYLDWAKIAASRFQRESNFVDAAEEYAEDHVPEQDPHFQTTRDAGDLNEPLKKLFDNLPQEKQKQILPILDQTISYIDEMHSSSMKRLGEVLNSAPTQPVTQSRFPMIRNLSRPASRPSSRNTSPVRDSNANKINPQQKSPSSASRIKDSDVPQVSSNPGPGAYLARWQDLLDSTPITPLTPYGKPAKASDKGVVEASAKDMDGGRMVDLTSGQQSLDAQKVKPNVSGGGTNGKGATVKKPNVKPVIDALGKSFRELLAERSCSW